MSISTWFHSFFDRFTKEVRLFIAFILPIAESKGGALIANALPLALTIVESLAKAGASGTAARDQAAGQLKDQIVSQGLAAASDIGASTLNYLVETALQHLKATSQ